MGDDTRSDARLIIVPDRLEVRFSCSVSRDLTPARPRDLRNSPFRPLSTSRWNSMEFEWTKIDHRPSGLLLRKDKGKKREHPAPQPTCSHRESPSIDPQSAHSLTGTAQRHNTIRADPLPGRHPDSDRPDPDQADERAKPLSPTPLHRPLLRETHVSPIASHRPKPQPTKTTLLEDPKLHLTGTEKRSKRLGQLSDSIALTCTFFDWKWRQTGGRGGRIDGHGFL
ncbi:hypothetical protein L1887_62812 [Cichorium endivia]|nr:hypothetical protein L1887_62812 [Cichorium endivia]